MKRAELIGTWIFGAASATAGVAAVIRWRNYRAALAEFQMPAHIEPGWYEECPECLGEGDHCLLCFDLGVVLHEH